jgi:hypothetical protein
MNRFDELNMNISNKNHDLNLLNLPNEILIIIFNKLNMVDIFYSLVNVNQRFNQIIFDPFYIRALNLTSMTMKSFFNRTISIENNILDKICSNILPGICHYVNELIIEQNLMERIFDTFNFPQLYSLSLNDFHNCSFIKGRYSKKFYWKRISKIWITCGNSFNR